MPLLRLIGLYDTLDEKLAYSSWITSHVRRHKVTLDVLYTEICVIVTVS